MKFKMICGILVLVLMVLATISEASGRNYSVEAGTGLGFDSNAFLTPDDSYFDPNLGVTVFPDKQSGIFIPLDIKAEYEHQVNREGLRSVSSINLRGEKYLGSDLNNADNYWLKAGNELEFLLRENGKLKDRFILHPYLAYNKEIFFDRDTGLEKTTLSTAQDISERYKYIRYGLDAMLKVRTTPVKYTLKTKIAIYDYASVPVISSLDHTYFLIGGEAEFMVSEPTSLELGYDLYFRSYKDKSARTLNGSLFTSNPDLKYTYHKLGVTLKHRLATNWRVYLGYDLLFRVDGFVGYNDYTRNRVRIRPKYRDEQGRKLVFKFVYWNRDYPRAFAFDDPNFINKSYKTLEFKVDGELPLKDRWKLWGNLEYLTQDTTDPRYNYGRFQIATGVGINL